MLFTDKTAHDPVLSRRQKVGIMELLRSGCSSTCGRAVGVVALVSAFLVTTEPLARQSPDDILTILTRQMAGLGGPLILSGAGPGAAAPTWPSADLSDGAVEVADATPGNILWPPGKPNPFDPGMIARGAVLPIIGDIREPSPEILLTDPPPLAPAVSAPEPPAGAHYTFAELFGSLVDLFADDDAPDTDADPRKLLPQPAATASVNPGEETAPTPAESARAPDPVAAGKADMAPAAGKGPPARRPAPPVMAGAPALYTESPATWALPADRTETPAWQVAPAPREAPAEPAEAPGLVLAAAEDEPAPPRGEVNYTFSELFGTLADFFSTDGDVMAEAPDVAPASALASAPEEVPEYRGDADETTLAAAVPGDGGRPLFPTRPDAPGEAPALADSPPTESADVMSRDEDAPRDDESVEFFAWIADAFTEAPAAIPEEATPGAILADAGPMDGGSNHALPETPSASSEFPEETPAFTGPPVAAPAPAPVADVISRDKDALRDEPLDITGLFAWITDAFSSAPGTTDEAAQAMKAPAPAQPPEGPDLALAELPDAAVSAGSSTTPSEWKDPDREMPVSLAELLGAPELARAAENMRVGRPKEKGVIDRLADLLITGDDDSSRPGDGSWAVKNVEIAQIPHHLPKKPRPARPKKHYLTGLVLKPGGTLSLGRPFRDRKPCIEKKRGSVVFCLEPVQWPRSLDPYFRIDSILYQGARVIVRYDEGIATTYHFLFDSSAFGRLVSHFEGRYGPPTEQLNRSIAPWRPPGKPIPSPCGAASIPPPAWFPRWKSASSTTPAAASPTPSGAPSCSITPGRSPSSPCCRPWNSCTWTRDRRGPARGRHHSTRFVKFISRGRELCRPFWCLRGCTDLSSPNTGD